MLIHSKTCFLFLKKNVSGSVTDVMSEKCRLSRIVAKGLFEIAKLVENMCFVRVGVNRIEKEIFIFPGGRDVMIYFSTIIIENAAVFLRRVNNFCLVKLELLRMK